MSADRPPRVDVIILSWNDGDLLERAIRSVLAQAGVDVRVIVVDNGSDPPVKPSDPVAELIRNDSNRGVAGGRNQGLRASTAPLVCVLDSDAELLPEALRLLTEPFVDERVGLTAPVIEGAEPEANAGVAPGPLRKLSRLAGLTSTYRAVPRSERDSIWEVDFAIGACQVFRRTAFDSVGGLDESYFYGPEDVDFCLRLRRRGWRVVQVQDAVCRHPPRRRFRRILTRRGAQHAWAVARHLWRHRGANHR